MPFLCGNLQGIVKKSVQLSFGIELCQLTSGFAPENIFFRTGNHHAPGTPTLKYQKYM